MQEVTEKEKLNEEEQMSERVERGGGRQSYAGKEGVKEEDTKF